VSSLPAQKSCHEKLKLLQDYVSLLWVYNDNVNRYSDFVRASLKGDDLTAMKRRLKESRVQFQEARANYEGHVEEHGC